jgi:mono/diheme cytochrome c family protein
VIRARLGALALPMALPLAVALLGGCRFGRGNGTSGGPDDAGSAADVDLDSPAGQGYLAVQARHCGICHQAPNPAAGVLAGQDAPVPGTQTYGSNLTPDPDTGMDAWDAGTIASSVLHSVAVDGGPLCSAMPEYAEYGMQAAEANAIAVYLQGLAPVWHLVPASRCASKASADAGDGG